MDDSADRGRFQYQMFLNQLLSQHTMFVHKYNYWLFWQEFGVTATSRKSAAENNYKYNPVRKHFYECRWFLFKTHWVIEHWED